MSSDDWFDIDAEYEIETSAIARALDSVIETKQKRLAYTILGAWIDGYEAVDVVDLTTSVMTDGEPFSVRFAHVPRRSIESAPLDPPTVTSTTTRYDVRGLTDTEITQLKRYLDRVDE